MHFEDTSFGTFLVHDSVAALLTTNRIPRLHLILTVTLCVGGVGSMCRGAVCVWVVSVGGGKCVWHVCVVCVGVSVWVGGKCGGW